MSAAVLRIPEVLRGRLPRRRARTDPAQEADGVAAVLERLAALAAAGATPAAGWRYVAAGASGGDRVLAERAGAAAARGDPLAPVFATEPAAWRAAGAAVALALETGAPLAPSLRTSAEAARRIGELHRAVSTAVAGPAASARLVLLLPPACALLGWAFGFDVPRVLFGGVLGALLLVAGSVLLAAAAVWGRRLVAQARRTSWTVGLDLDLVATAVRAGLPVQRAVHLATGTATTVGVELDDGAGLRAVLGFAADAGLPVAALLIAEADRMRRDAIAAARVRAETLAVRLLLPLGLLVLPAFLLLGAVPIGLAVLSSTALPL